MLPIVQFDPASLTIFAEGPTLGLEQDTARLVDATILGDTQALSRDFKLISGRKKSGRALQLTSAFLHEKRHFLDFAATNYGAFRFRQFQEIYANLPTLLNAGRKMERLYLPIEVYLDPVRRYVLGVEEPPEEVMQIAKVLAKRRKMVEKDRQPFTTRLGTFEIGGEAQLEALAYAAQSRFVAYFGGHDAHEAFSDFVFDREQFQSKYSAFLTVGVSAGLVPIRHLEALENRTDEINHRAFVDFALLECVIFASLQSDYVNGENVSSESTIASSYPAERFAAIAFHLAQEHKSLCENTDGLDWHECWNVVDDTCQKLFGLRVHEQIARDIEQHEEHHSKLKQSEDETLIGFGEDFLELRKELCDRTQHSPLHVVSTEYFAVTAGRDVAPITVMVSSQGEIGDVPNGYARIMAYDTTHELSQDCPWRKWWWAAAIEPSEDEAATTTLRIKRRANAYKIIDTYAPTSKLILNGRKIRTLIGPELLFAEQRAAANIGAKFAYYPGFEFPDDEIPEDVFRFLKPDEELICDYSNKIVPNGEAVILTPWALRRYPDLSHFTIQHMGGHDVAYHLFVKDWSHWAVSKEVMTQLRPLMMRHFKFGDLDANPSLADEQAPVDISRIRIKKTRRPANVRQLVTAAKNLAK